MATGQGGTRFQSYQSGMEIGCPRNRVKAGVSYGPYKYNSGPLGREENSETLKIDF